MQVRTEILSFEGEVGNIECALDRPAGEVRGWALVLHPHPLHGGARNNKVVTTIARACTEHGLVALRPNFRGVGDSAGEFDQARGETTDMLRLVGQFQERYPEIAAGQWLMAGFSFGTAVAAQLYSELATQSLRTPDRLILTGTAVERFRFRDVCVPEDTVLVHGEADEVVPLSEAMEFARGHKLPVVVIPDSTHFFHGRLLMLRHVVQQSLRAL
ncbi:alpha/beta hydrolase [Achromobacter sp. F4_2707]|uniref:alpha/beta hydrolase n=1 Tax=Achromobacter sp. F4_2707 TaxID=3114286 RepID=UPI0039C60B16